MKLHHAHAHAHAYFYAHAQVDLPLEIAWTATVSWWADEPTCKVKKASSNDRKTKIWDQNFCSEHTKNAKKLGIRNDPFQTFS